MSPPDYRDALGAAHARIAELEEKVAALESALARPHEPPAARVRSLNAQLEKHRALARTKWYALGFRPIGLLVCASFLVFAVARGYGADLTALAAAGFVLAIGIIAVMIAGRGERRVARRAARAAEARLAEARQELDVTDHLLIRPRVVENGPRLDAETEAAALEDDDVEVEGTPTRARR